MRPKGRLVTRSKSVRVAGGVEDSSDSNEVKIGGEQEKQVEEGVMDAKEKERAAKIRQKLEDEMLKEMYVVMERYGQYTRKWTDITYFDATGYDDSRGTIKANGK